MNKIVQISGIKTVGKKSEQRIRVFNDSTAIITGGASGIGRALDAGEGFPIITVFGEYLKHPERIYEWEPDPLC